MSAPDKIGPQAVLAEFAFKVHPFGDEATAIAKYRQARADMDELVKAAGQLVSHIVLTDDEGLATQAPEVERVRAALAAFGEQP